MDDSHHIQVNSSLPLRGKFQLSKRNEETILEDNNLYMFFDIETDAIEAFMGENEIKNISILSSFDISNLVTENLRIIYSELNINLYINKDFEKGTLKNYIDLWIKDTLTSDNVHFLVNDKLVISPPFDQSSLPGHGCMTINSIIEPNNILDPPFGCQTIKLTFMKWHKPDSYTFITPTINYDSGNKDLLLLHIPLLSISYFSKNDNLVQSLISHRNSIIEDLYNNIENMIFFDEIENRWIVYTLFHFKPFKYHDVISLYYPIDSYPQISEKLKATYGNILLSSSVEMYDPRNSIQPDQKSYDNNKLSNIHNYVSKPDGSIVTVQGKYDYYHYCMDGIMDNGWGCAYRSFQTICSWLIYQNFINAKVPTHIEIQKALVEMGDKDRTFIGSKEWIGAVELSFCLDFMFNIRSKILNINSGSEMDSLSEILENHFRTIGSPVMVGGGVLAYTLLGIATSYKDGIKQVLYLILDPHYRGEDKIEKIISKGWCGWKKSTIWKKEAFYNLCLPLVSL